MNRRTNETGATPDERGQAGEDAKSMLKEEADKARDAATQAADAGKERLEEGAGQAAEGVSHVADAVGAAASRLSETEHEGLADYANRLASWLGDMSEKLRSRNVEEFGDDIRRVAERNPALFVLGSIAAGVALARFAKASSENQGRAWNGAAGQPGWARGEYGEYYEGTAESERQLGAGRQAESEWTEEIATHEYEPRGPSLSGEGVDRGNAGGHADRPGTPDSSGGSGL